MDSDEKEFLREWLILNLEPVYAAQCGVTYRYTHMCRYVDRDAYTFVKL